MKGLSNLATFAPVSLLLSLSALSAYWMLSAEDGVFAWGDLAITYVACAMPSAVALALAAEGRAAQSPKRSSLTWMAAGLLFAAALAWWAIMSGTLGPRSFWSAHFVRALSAVAWMTAIVAALAGLLRSRAGPHSATKQRFSPTTWMLALAAMLGLPALYTLERGRRETLEAENAILAGRFTEARRRLAQLTAAGSPFFLGGLAPSAALVAATERVRQLEARVAVALPNTATDAERLVRAEDLLALERLPESLQIAAHCSDRFPPAALLAGHVCSRQADWKQACAHYLSALALLARAEPNAQVTAAQVRAYDALAFNLRELGQFNQAAAAYEAAIKALPSAAAHFHYQLGLHLQRYGDRPAAAKEEFAKAADLDPSLGETISSSAANELVLPFGNCRWLAP